MVGWLVNDAQKAVLAWLVGGQNGDAPSEAWKVSARSLSSRGLVTVSRRGGTFRAEVTAAGRFFHEHGQYPQGSNGAKWAPDSLVAPDVLEARRSARIAAARPEPKKAGQATSAPKKRTKATSMPTGEVPGTGRENRATSPATQKSPTSASRELVAPPSGPAMRIT